MRTLVIALLISASLVLQSCSSGESPRDEKKRPVAPVTAAIAEKRDVPVDLSAIGQAAAYSTVSVRSQVGGQLQSINFKEGADVKKGQILFVIDPRPFEVALRQAEANLSRGIIQMENAKAEARRYKELADEGYATQSQYDLVRTSAGVLEATVKAEKANLEYARLQLSYTKIYAPLSGRTGSLLVNEGNLVKANDDKALVVISMMDPIYVSFSVPEEYLPEVKMFMAKSSLKVEVSAPQSGLGPETGELTFIDSEVDRSTGTIRMKGTFDNRGKSLWPGQFLEVRLRLTTEAGAILVPSQAVQTGQSGLYIFVVKPDGTAELRPVIVSRTIGNESVIGKGLDPGERVVTDGQLQLTPGAKVEIKDGVGGEKATR